MEQAIAALEGIQRYGLDTLSGRTDGPDDRAWQRAGVNEMTKRARLGIAPLRAALAEPAPVQEPENHFKSACWLRTSFSISRYLMSNAHGRWNGAEKALYHRELCKFYVAAVRGFDDEGLVDLCGEDMQWASGKVEEILACKLGEEATAAAEKAEQERVKAEQKAEAEKLAFQRRLMEEERAAIQADLDAKAAMQREEQDRLKAEADAAEAKVRAAAEAMAAERAELDRMRAEFERQKAEETLAKAAKAAEAFVVPPVAETDKPTTGIFSEMTVAEVSERITVEAEQHTYTVMPPEPAIVEAPRAPVASAIVLAVAEFWHTDNKTAARWITERAAEIESLQ